MYNYLVSIFLLLASINYGPLFIMTCNSIYNYYKQKTRDNSLKLLFLMSFYLFGFGYTLYYSLIGLLGCILYNYDNVIMKFNKLKSESIELLEFYENKKNNDIDEIPFEVQIIREIIVKYDMLINQLNMQKNKLMGNAYCNKIQQIICNVYGVICNIDYQYCIDYTNTFIEKLIEIANNYIDSNPNIKKYKDEMNDYLQKFKNLNIKPDNNIGLIDDKNLSLPDMEKMLFMENMIKQMNLDDCMPSMPSTSSMPNMFNMPNDTEQPSIENINKLMETLNTLQKMSQNVENLSLGNELNNLSRSQRRMMEKNKKSKNGLKK